MSGYDDYKLNALKDTLARVEATGKAMRAALDAGQEAYRPLLQEQRERYKKIKAQIAAMQGASAPAAAAPAARQPLMSPADFHRLCAQHDWDYEMSDDAGAYRAGKAHEDKINAVVDRQPELAPILKGWQAYAKGGDRPEEPAV